MGFELTELSLGATFMRSLNRFTDRTISGYLHTHPVTLNIFLFKIVKGILEIL